MAAIATINLFDAKSIFNDFSNFPLTIQNELIYDNFMEYYEKRIHKTELFEIMFNYFFPNELEINSDILFNHLFKLVFDYIEDNVRSGEDTDDE